VIRFELVDGRIALTADAPDIATLTRLSEQFTELLDRPDHSPTAIDPALRRLLPDPLPGDPAESAELRALTVPALVAHKRENATRVAATLSSPGPLGERDELAWLQWLTDVRLVVASRLGILLDGDEPAPESAAEQAMTWTYHALGALQADLLECIDERGGAR